MSNTLTSPYDRGGALRYVEAFRRHWSLIVILVVAAVSIAALTAYTADERYEATADVLIVPLDSGDETFRGFTLFRQSLTSSSPVVLAARVLGSSEIYARAYSRLGERGQDVSIALRPLSQADVVVVEATGPEAEIAALAANTFAEAAIEERTAVFQRELAARIESLEQRAAAVPESERSGNFEYASLRQQLGELRAFEGSPDPTLRMLRPATPPGAAAWPRTGFSIAVAFGAALLLGAALAVGLEFLNPRVMREEELTHGHRLPILARIPRVPGRTLRQYLAGSRSFPGPAWTGYRTLRAVLAAAGGGGYPRSILVTSASAGDGKTLTAVNLAITLASANLRVVLVDADPYRPMVASVFGARQREDGFARLLAGTAEVSDVLVPAGDPPSLSLVLSSREHSPFTQAPAWWASSAAAAKWPVVEAPSSQPADRVKPTPRSVVTAEHLLDVTRFSAMLDALADHADVVVIDSPPVPDVAETLALVEAVDAVLIAVRLGHTRRDKLAQLGELLARREILPLGFVLTVRDRPRETSAYYGYVGSLSAPAIQFRPPREEPEPGRTTRASKR